MHYKVVPWSRFLFKESIPWCSLLSLLAVHHQCPVHEVHLCSEFFLLQINFTFDHRRQLAGFVLLLFALRRWKNACVFQPFDNGQIHISGRLDRSTPLNKASVRLLENLIVFISRNRIWLAVKIFSIQTLQVKKARYSIWHSFLRLQTLVMMVLSRLAINCRASLSQRRSSLSKEGSAVRRLDILF